MEQLTHEEISRKKYLARGAGDEATKAYIANKYLGGGENTSLSIEEKKKKKKKKRLSTSAKRVGNFNIIDEDDDTIWSKETVENEADDSELLENAEETTSFRSTTQNWETIREGDASIMNSYEEGSAEEEQPTVVMDEDVESLPRHSQHATSTATPTMSNGQKAGILTKEEIKKEAERARQLEKEAVKRIKLEQQGDTENTVYRDVSGRKIDPKQKKAEEMRRRREKIEREAERMEWGKGLVQRREAEEQKKRLEEEKHKPLARYVDDQDFNEELRQQARWNDPAAGFLTNNASVSKDGKRFVKPTYNGPWKPNRFMIPPGYRWDGVDRSNGYEDKFLLQQNQSKSRAAEAFAWSTEDM